MNTILHFPLTSIVSEGGRADSRRLRPCCHRRDGSRRLSDEEDEAIARDTGGWATEMDGRRVRLTGNRLGPSAGGKSVRVRGGNLSVTEGPFTETKQLLAGFDILDCSGLDEAIEVGAKHSVARYCAVEVRALRGAEKTWAKKGSGGPPFRRPGSRRRISRDCLGPRAGGETRVTLGERERTYPGAGRPRRRAAETLDGARRGILRL